jgi:hypothetical protein
LFCILLYSLNYLCEIVQYLPFVGVVDGQMRSTSWQRGQAWKEVRCTPAEAVAPEDFLYLPQRQLQRKIRGNGASVGLPLIHVELPTVIHMKHTKTKIKIMKKLIYL